MPQSQTFTVAKVSKKALEHNKEFFADQKRGKIVGCHHLAVMMEKMKKELIPLCVKNTPKCGLPEGVYSLYLTFERTTGELTDKSTEKIASNPDKTSKGKSTSRKLDRQSRSKVYQETSPTELRSHEASRKGGKEKKGRRKKPGKQGEGDTRREEGASCKRTRTEEGAAGGGTCTEEGAAGGDPRTEEGAVGGGTCTEEGAADEDLDTRTEEGAAGGGTCTKEGTPGGDLDTRTEEGAAGGGTCTKEGAAGGDLDTRMEEGAAGGGTCTEEGATGGDPRTEEGASGGGTCTEEGAADGDLDTRTEEGAAGGDPRTEEGAAGGGTCTEEGATGGDSRTEEGAAGGGTFTEEGAAAGSPSTKEGAAGLATRKKEGAAGGDIGRMDLRNAAQTRRRNRNKLDVTLLTQVGIHKDEWEVTPKTVHKPILKSVYEPSNWSEEKLTSKCQEAFRHACENGSYKYVTESKDAKNSRIFWEGWFNVHFDKETTKRFWIAGYSDRLNKNKSQQRKVKLEDFEVSTFYFIHDSDRTIEDE